LCPAESHTSALMPLVQGRARSPSLRDDSDFAQANLLPDSISSGAFVVLGYPIQTRVFFWEVRNHAFQGHHSLLGFSRKASKGAAYPSNNKFFHDV
jgi:hypothetical protein